MTRISQSAFDLIVAEEVSGRNYYERHYRTPEWPGGASGVTIAIGYDLGYATPDKIREDWGSRVPPDMLKAMLECAGVKGAAAKTLAARMHNRINIPWDTAIEVFADRDVPQWTAQVLRSCPGAEKLSPTCLGVIVSTAYNRGASFNLPGDRYKEMRDIKAEIGKGQFSLIPGELRSMKRLWPGVKGLRDRREREAKLFEAGMVKGTDTVLVGPPAPAEPEPAVIVSSRPDLPARTPAPPTTASQNSTAGAIVAGGVVAAQQAHSAGYHWGAVAGIAAVGCLIALIVWAAWYAQRNPRD